MDIDGNGMIFWKHVGTTKQFRYGYDMIWLLLPIPSLLSGDLHVISQNSRHQTGLTLISSEFCWEEHSMLTFIWFHMVSYGFTYGFIWFHRMRSNHSIESNLFCKSLFSVVIWEKSIWCSMPGMIVIILQSMYLFVAGMRMKTSREVWARGLIGNPDI